MKRISLAVLAAVTALSAACGSKYKAPPPVASIALPSGADLKPYAAASPGLARPSGMAELNGKAYVALGNYDASYAVRGPGLLAVVVPSTGAVTLIDLGGSDGKKCQNAGFVRVADTKLLVTCGGDYNTGTGTAVVEIDPATSAVTRSLTLPSSPSGVAISPTRLWLGDATSGKVYPVDRQSFSLAGAPVTLQCPATGYATVNDLLVVGTDLFALCTNNNGGFLNRLDATTGAAKSVIEAGPVAAAMALTGDGRIALVSGLDNKLRLVTITGSALAVEVGFTFNSQTSTLQDVRARDQFVFTVASGSNTVQKIDLSAKGGPALVAEKNVGLGTNPWNVLPLDGL